MRCFVGTLLLLLFSCASNSSPIRFHFCMRLLVVVIVVTVRYGLNGIEDPCRSLFRSVSSPFLTFVVAR